MPSVAELFVNVGADVSGALKGLNTVQAAVQGAATSLNKTGHELSTAITVPIVASAAAIVGFGTGFEHAFTGVRKTVDESTTNMDDLRKGILDLSTISAGGGKTAEELAGIAEIAGSMGIEGVDNILKFTQTIAGISVSTGLASDQVARDMAAFLIAVGLPIDDIDRLGSTVTDLGNRTGATEAQITGFNLRLGGALGVAKATAAQISGISTTLGELQINEEAGGTAVSKFFTEMVRASSGVGGKMVDNTQKVRELQDKINDLSGSLQTAEERQKAFGRNTPAAVVSSTADAVARYRRELSEAQADLVKVNSTQGKAVGSAENFARIAGLTTDEFKDLVKTDPTEAFTRIIEGIAKIRETEGAGATFAALADLGIDESRMQATLSLLSAGHEKLRKNVVLANAAWDENTATQEEVKKAMEDTTNQFNLMTNQIKRVLIDGWFLLRPIILEVGAALRDTIVPALQGALQWFRALSPEQQKSALAWIAVAAAVGPALIILGAAVGAIAALLTPIGLVVIAVGLLAAAWATNFGDIQGKAEAVWNFISDNWRTLLGVLTLGLSELVIAFVNNFDSIKAVVGGAFSFIGAALDLQKVIVDRALREIGSFFEKFLLPPMQAISGWIAEHIIGPFLGVVRFIQGIINAMFPGGAPGGFDFGAALAQGEAAMKNLTADVAAGGPGGHQFNAPLVVVNNPVITDQASVDELIGRVGSWVTTALVASENAAVPPLQGQPGVPF